MSFKLPIHEVMNPQVHLQRPGGKGPISRPKKGKWDEASVERDLPYIEEAIRIIDEAQTAIQLDKGNAVKASLRLELEQAGWQYNRRATFKANFLFRSKYLVFNSSYKQDHKNSYRIKVATGHGIVSDYKLMKWVPRY